AGACARGHGDDLLGATRRGPVERPPAAPAGTRARRNAIAADLTAVIVNVNSSPLRDHVPEGEVHTRPHRTAGLRHPVPPPRDRVTGDEQHAPGLEVDRLRSTPSVPDLEAPDGAQADRADVRLPAVRIVAVAVPAHRIAPIAV